MRQKKRLSIILALVMFLSLLPIFSAPALADSIIFDESQLAVVNPRDPADPFADITVAPDGKSVTIISVPRQDMVTGTQGYTGLSNVLQIPFDTVSTKGSWTAVLSVSMSSDFGALANSTTVGFGLRDPATGAYGIIGGRRVDTTNIKGYTRSNGALVNNGNNQTAGSNMGTGNEFQLRMRKLDNQLAVDMYRTTEDWFDITTSQTGRFYGFAPSFNETAVLELFVQNPSANPLSATFTLEITYAIEETLNSILLPDILDDSYQLPAQAGGFDLKWACNTPGILAVDGRTIIAPLDAAKNVILSATINDTTKDFPVTIAKLPTPEDLALAAIYVPSFLSDGYELPLTSEAFDISWTCNTPGVLAANGSTIIARVAPQNVILTAKAGVGSDTAYRDFPVKVMQFDTGAVGTDSDVVSGMTPIIVLDFEENPVNNFFNDQENGARARARRGTSATTTTAPILTWGEPIYGGRSAVLSADFHLELTKLDGSALLKGLNDFVVSYDIKPTGTSDNNLWVFTAKPTRSASRTDSGGWEHYLAIRDSATDIEARSWYNTGSRPAVNNSAAPASWRHVDVHFEKDRTTVYLNGVAVSSLAAEFSPAHVITAAGGYAYVGFIPTGTTTAEFFTGEIDNFKIWKPTDPDDAGKVAAAKAALGLNVNTTDMPVYGNINLPEKGLYDTDITWQTSRPDIVDLNRYENAGYDPKLPGVVTRPTDKDTLVTMTATISSAEVSDTKQIQILVKKSPGKSPGPEDFEAYIYAHFTGDQNYQTDEQIYFAVSLDGVNWVDTRLRGDPALHSDKGDGAVRDPYIVRSPEGDKFYLIATDLNVYKRNNGFGGWGGTSSEMSPFLAIWESTDLVNWSDMRLVDMTSRLFTGSIRAWAPEIVYDELTGDYFVFWSSDQGGSSGIHYARTRDFQTFSETRYWGSAGGLDTTLLRVGDRWFRSGASGNSSIQVSADLRITGSWTNLGSVEAIFGQSSFTAKHGALEGQEFLLYNQKDWPDPETPLYGLFGDRHQLKAGYVRLTTTDLSSRSTQHWKDEGGITSDLTGANVPGGERPSKRHGNLMSLTKDEYLRVIAGFTRGADSSVIIPSDYELIAAFGFNHLPESGNEEFYDQTGNAKIAVNSGEWHRSRERAPGEVGGFSVDLSGGNNWLNLTKSDGSALLRDENGKLYREVIITYNSRTTAGDGWSFLASGSGQSIGIKDKPGAMEVVRGNNSSAPALIGSNKLAADTWKGVVLYLGRNYTELYVDGVRVAWQDGHPTLEQIMGAGGGAIQIGKYFQGQIDDLKIYALPLDATQNQAPQPHSNNIPKSATPTAFVTKLNGNKNDLTISVIEQYGNGISVEYKETIKIDNNAAGTYKVGPYKVYVDTKGNTQIRDIYIVK